MWWMMLLACTTESDPLSLHCTLDTPSFAPATAAPGDTVVATTRPLTELWDTTVHVAGTPAEVVALSRGGEEALCDACDSCREDAGCTACDACLTCTEACSTCVETVSFVVPSVALGAAAVTVTNVHGSTSAGRLTVVGETADTGDTAE